MRKPGKDDYTVPKSYRSIALMNTVGKIMNAVVARRLSYHPKAYEVLPRTHMSGRKMRSNEHAINAATHKIYVEPEHQSVYLIKYGANVRTTAASGATPVHNAARRANIEAVGCLVNQNADANIVTTDGKTMVHAACAMPNSTTCRPYHIFWKLYPIMEWK